MRLETNILKREILSVGSNFGFLNSKKNTKINSSVDFITLPVNQGKSAHHYLAKV